MPPTMPPTQHLDDLLALCQRDQLIDAFERHDDEVVIRLGYAQHRLTPPMAVRFLEGVLKYAPDLYSIALLFAHADQTGRPRPRPRRLVVKKVAPSS